MNSMENSKKKDLLNYNSIYNNLSIFNIEERWISKSLTFSFKKFLKQVYVLSLNIANLQEHLTPEGKKVVLLPRLLGECHIMLIN